MKGVEETIKDRNSKYGSFPDYAAICYNLKSNIRFAKKQKIAQRTHRGARYDFLQDSANTKR